MRPSGSRLKWPCWASLSRIPQDGRAQGLGGIAVVMEVELDLAVASASELGQGVEELRGVLLAGKEERVLGFLAVGVAKGIGQPRDSPLPRP